MKICDFVKRFEYRKELESWLQRQNKDYLYSLYMEDTNYDGAGYRHITRAELKEIFLVRYEKIEDERREYENNNKS